MAPIKMLKSLLTAASYTDFTLFHFVLHEITGSQNTILSLLFQIFDDEEEFGKFITKVQLQGQKVRPCLSSSI